VISKPLTCIESFRDTGIPASGPFRLTSFFAQSSASGNSISVTQFVFSCALIATLPYARRISTGLVTCLCTSWTSSWIGFPNIVRSCEESGYWYGCGRLAILDARSDCFRALGSQSQLLRGARIVQWGRYAYQARLCSLYSERPIFTSSKMDGQVDCEVTHPYQCI
jgi:hypothetical protein